MPLNRGDVPAGMKCEPHESGKGVKVDPDGAANHQAINLLPEAAMLSEIYIALRSRAAGSGFGPSPITWEAIGAYCRVTRTTLDRWTLDLLQMCDGIFLKYAAEKAERERKANQKQGQR